MALELEYLAEALEEAEASARWYAEQSPLAAEGFDGKLGVAERAISDNQRRGQHSITAPVVICSAAIHSASFIELSLIGSSSSLSLTLAGNLDIGRPVREGLPNIGLQPTAAGAVIGAGAIGVVVGAAGIKFAMAAAATPPAYMTKE